MSDELDLGEVRDVLGVVKFSIAGEQHSFKLHTPTVDDCIKIQEIEDMVNGKPDDFDLAIKRVERYVPGLTRELLMQLRPDQVKDLTQFIMKKIGDRINPQVAEETGKEEDQSVLQPS